MRHKNHIAFTLIELLLAMVLTTCLMVGVLAVVADLAKPQSASAQDIEVQTDIPDPIVEWVKLLREDINHSSGIAAMDKNNFALVGLSALSADDRRCTHRPVLVGYKLRDVGGKKFIVRSQRSLDILTNNNIQNDLICSDVESFEVIAEGLDKEILLAGSVNNKKQELFAARKEPEKKDAAQSNTGVAAGGESKGYIVNGLHFFPKYAPAWVKAKALKESAGASKDECEKSVEKEHTAEKEMRIIWRLRIMRYDGGSIERLIMIQGSELL